MHNIQGFVFVRYQRHRAVKRRLRNVNKRFASSLKPTQWRKKCVWHALVTCYVHVVLGPEWEWDASELVRWSQPVSFVNQRINLKGWLLRARPKNHRLPGHLSPHRSRLTSPVSRPIHRRHSRLTSRMVTRSWKSCLSWVRACFTTHSVRWAENSGIAEQILMSIQPLVAWTPVFFHPVWFNVVSVVRGSRRQ